MEITKLGQTRATWVVVIWIGALVGSYLGSHPVKTVPSLLLLIALLLLGILTELESK